MESRNLSVTIKNVTAQWNQPKTRDRLQNGTKKIHEPQDHSGENELNGWKLATLNNLNAEFPKSKLIGTLI